MVAHLTYRVYRRHRAPLPEIDCLYVYLCAPVSYPDETYYAYFAKALDHSHQNQGFMIRARDIDEARSLLKEHVWNIWKLQTRFSR